MELSKFFLRGLYSVLRIIFLQWCFYTGTHRHAVDDAPLDDSESLAQR